MPIKTFTRINELIEANIILVLVALSYLRLISFMKDFLYSIKIHEST